jgi:transcriptional regulator with XRE-family HTH domain
MTIGERIKELREKSGITQSELAAAVGTIKSSISMYESNQRKTIPKARLDAIAKCLGTSPAYLTYGVTATDTLQSEFADVSMPMYKLNGIDALAVLEHGLEDWLGIKGRGEPTAEAELVSIGAYPEYAELTFKHNDNTYAFVFRKENK